MTLTPTDPGAGAWLRPRLAGSGSCLGAIVPQGFEAYARILHPVQLGAGRWGTWADVGARTGRSVGPLDPFWRVAGLSGYRDHAEDEPLEGCLAEHAFLALVEVLACESVDGYDTPCVVAMWHGFGAFHASGRTFVWLTSDGAPPEHRDPPPPPYPREVLDGPTLALPGREYWTFAATLATADAPSRYDEWAVGDRAGWQSPQLLWPEDRSWCVATEIDYDSTLVGGSTALVARILADPRLEAFAVDPADGVAHR